MQCAALGYERSAYTRYPAKKFVGNAARGPRIFGYKVNFNAGITQVARGPEKWNEATIERLQLEGHGKGSGPDYKPWIGIHEFSSLGRSRRVPGLITNREHHLFSDVEWNLFLLLEWSQGVVDIREQFPLDRGLTQEIAAACCIRHPHYPGTHVPTVMTVDFLVTRIRNGKNELEAFNTKRKEEAEVPASLEKLEIQRRYFDGAGIPHHLVFHSDIPMTKVRNLEWIRSAHHSAGELEPYPGFYEEHTNSMALDLTSNTRTTTLSEYCAKYDSRRGLEQGTGLRIARMLMQSRVLIPDLNNEILATAPLAAFQVSARPGQLKIIGGS